MQRIRHHGRRLAVVVAAIAIVAGFAVSPAAAAGEACTVVYHSPPSYNWDGGFQADITVTNYGEPIDGWTFGWQFTAGQQVAEIFGAEYSQYGPWVAASNKVYNASIPSGSAVGLIVLASRGATNPPPQVFYLNSYPCALIIR